MLDFEASLARAESALGIIPVSALQAIEGCCKSERFDLEKLASEASVSGNVAIPMVRQLTELVSRTLPEAAGFVHWGATSQDAIDTGFVLQIREELTLFDDELMRVCDQLAALCERHRHTIMPGRTWLQHAVPVTFGLVAATWLDSFLRHRNRLSEARYRVLTVQFGGAAGTLASLGNRGLEVATILARDLNLGCPALPWHTQGDRFAELATLHGLVMGTLSKVAGDIALLMQTELGELSESASAERGGSSTMPHKRNPVGSSAILASGNRVPGLVTSMLSGLHQEHQRGVAGWQSSWETLPEICLLTLGSLETFITILDGLVVNSGAMQRSLGLTSGLLQAEAVSMALAEKIGRAEAHVMTEHASRQAIRESVPLRQIVERDAQMMNYLTPQLLDQLFDPASYLGETKSMIERVLLNHSSLHAGVRGRH